MKRRFLCRVTSFALAAILATESSMTASAAQNVVPQETLTVETETVSETESTSEAEPEIVEEGEEESESEFESESESSFETAEETECVSEAESETETELPAELKMVLDGTGEELAAPVITNLQVSAEGKVSFEWELISGAEGYHVYRTETQNEGDRIVQADLTTDNTKAYFTDASAQLGTAYYYKVCAYKKENGKEKEGPFSAYASSEIELTDLSFGAEAGATLTLKCGETKQLSLVYTPVNATRTTPEWTSSDEKVVTVSENGTVTAVGTGTAKITAAVGEKQAEVTVTVETKIALNKTQLTIYKGTVGVLEAFVTPSDKSADVVWTTDNNNIKIPDGKKTGKVTNFEATQVGQSVITATVDGKSAECVVNVIVPVNKITLDKNTVDILKEDSKVVTVNISPKDATVDEITAVAENGEIVSCHTEIVTEGTEKVGKVTLTAGERLGTTKVNITADGQSATLTVNVVEEEDITEETSDRIPVRKVTFNLTDLERTIILEPGDGNNNKYPLTAQVLPANATDKGLTWTSSDEKVAVVSDLGLITAVGKGSAQITAKTENGVYDKVTVIVTNEVEEVEIIEDEFTLYCNADKDVFNGKMLQSAFQLNMRDPSLQYEFRSSNEKVATVNESGLVTAVAPGTAQIVVVHPESRKSDAITITVEKLVEKIKLPVSETTVALGTKIKVTEEVLPTDATKKEVRWYVTSESSRNCMEYDESKKVFIAQKVGTAKIVAKAKDNGRVVAEMLVTIEDSQNLDIAARCSLTYNKNTTVSTKSGMEFLLETKLWDKNRDELSLEERTIVYTSSNEKVATVDENGKVTAVAGGTAKITARVMDGSNISGTCTINVIQRPEEITFQREEYLVAPDKSVRLSPIILPANTNSNMKAVAWAVTGIDVPEDYTFSDADKKKLVTVDANGNVKVSKNAPENLTATIQCTSKAFGKTETAVSKEVTITVGKASVSKLALKKTSLELTGLGAKEQLEFGATVVKDAPVPPSYVWTSSNENVVTVNEDGLVTATGYGTAKVTLCADNALAVSCSIAVYPVKKGQNVAAASNNYGIQQASNEGNDFVQLSFVNSSTKSALSADLFTFTSSNPDLVYVDENGIAYANPKTVVKKDTTVTVTATLKDDPLKRKATTRVTVWAADQVKNIEFQYQGIGENGFRDFTDCGEEEFKVNSTFKLRAKVYDADYHAMQDAKLTFSISDSSMAQIQVDKTDETGHTIIVTVKKPGKFKITCTAKDKKHVSRQATFGMYSGTPILKSDSLGTINKASEQSKATDIPMISSDTTFTMVGANGTKLEGDNGKVDITVNAVKVTNLQGKNTVVDGGEFLVVKEGESTFRLQISSEALQNIKEGTYTVELSVKRSYMDIENKPASTKTEIVKSTFKIVDTVPSVSISNTTVNSFERGTWTKLKVNTKAEVEEITFAGKQVMEDYYKIMEKQDGWYIAIKEDKFDECASKSIKGSFFVKLKGYEKPVKVSTTVTAKSTQPSLKQLNVPDILVAQGMTAQITLYNNTTKEDLTDYQVTLKSDKNKKWDMTGKSVSDVMEVKLVDSVANIRSVSSYKQRVIITKDGWRTPVELDIMVKASPKATNPSISFGKSQFTLNTEAVNETCTVAVKSNKNNVAWKDEWNADNFVKPAYADLFTVEYQNGNLTIGLQQEAVDNKLYKAAYYDLQFIGVIDGYDKVKTANIRVYVGKSVPKVNVSNFSGKLDLINRKASTLATTVSVSGVTAEIQDISLGNGADESFTDKFYCVQDKNKITIYAKNAADLSTAVTYKGKVKVTLKNGTVLEKDISFKVTQSIPSLKTVAAKTIYKAESDKVVDYNLNEMMPNGVKISKIETRVLPAGLGIEYDNGHAYVVLNDDTIKPGTYTIQADVYLKGAQKVTNSEFGRPVRIKINVQVKEQ